MPVVIAFNWLLVINGSICLARRVVPGLPVFLRQRARPADRAPGVLFDVILEPVAIRLGYWQWLGRCRAKTIWPGSSSRLPPRCSTPPVAARSGRGMRR